VLGRRYWEEGVGEKVLGRRYWGEGVGEKNVFTVSFSEYFVSTDTYTP